MLLTAHLCSQGYIQMHQIVWRHTLSSMPGSMCELRVFLSLLPRFTLHSKILSQKKKR
jgi:hypothetical protein